MFLGGVQQDPVRKLAGNTSVTCSTASNGGDGGCRWVWHDGLVYATVRQPSGGGGVPPASLTVANKVVTGNEYRITQGDTKNITGGVFSAFLTHPPTPSTNLTYAYAIAASASVADVRDTLAQMDARVTVVANTKPLQAVCTRGDLLQAIIWPSSPTAAASSSLRRTSSSAAAATSFVGAAWAGCWDVTVDLPPAAPQHGLILQIRRGTNLGGATGFAISAVAPGLRVGGPSYTATVKIASRGMQLTSLPSDGAIGGSSGCDGNGAVVVLNSTGASSTVWCNMLA